MDALSDWLLAVAFAPDGVLASATNEAIVVWDAAERQVLRTIPLPGNRARGAVPFWPSALAFSADGRLVIATDASRRTMRAWELVSGRELSDFVGILPSGALSVAAAPDGVSFVTGHWDTTLLLGDIPALLRGPGARATPRPPSKERLRVLWQALADSDDAGRALRAVGELAASPAQAVPFLAGEVEEPTPPPDRLARLIADLDTKNFATREKATRELAEIGGPAEPALREAIRKGASAEAGRRIEGLLAAVRSQNSPASRRWSRAVQALEYAGTPEAAELLKRIRQGVIGGRHAEQAGGALDRLALRVPDPTR